MDNPGIDSPVAEKAGAPLHQSLQIGEEVTRNGLSGLDLRGKQSITNVEEEVDLKPLAVAEEEARPMEAAVKSRFQHLRHDPILEERTAQGVAA